MEKVAAFRDTPHNSELCEPTSTQNFPRGFQTLGITRHPKMSSSNNPSTIHPSTMDAEPPSPAANGRSTSPEKRPAEPEADKPVKCVQLVTFDGADTRRARTRGEDQARGRRMFGNILGTLRKFQDEDKSAKRSDAVSAATARRKAGGFRRGRCRGDELSSFATADTRPSAARRRPRASRRSCGSRRTRTRSSGTPSASCVPSSCKRRTRGTYSATARWQ
jgi:hypothetical protein